MQTPVGAHGLAFEDRIARVRVRDVALQHVAEHGQVGATLRGITADAGVSPGLV